MRKKGIEHLFIRLQNRVIKRLHKTINLARVAQVTPTKRGKTVLSVEEREGIRESNIIVEILKKSRKYDLKSFR